jgi:hypothetical protein
MLYADFAKRSREQLGGNEAVGERLLDVGI